MAEENKENTAKIDQSQQDKLKVKNESENKDDAIKEESPEKLREMLTNKNVSYVFRLQKELEKQGKLSIEDAKIKVDKLLPEIVIAQRHGQPANGLYMASPVIKADQILHPEVKPRTAEDVPFWQKGVDAALLFMSLFMAFYGISNMATPQKNVTGYGITSIIILSIILGVGITKTNDLLVPDKKTKKIAWPRVILGMLSLIAALIIVTMLLSMKSLQFLNPVFPGVVYLIIAAITFGIRYWFRRQFNVVGSIFTPVPRK